MRLLKYYMDKVLTVYRCSSAIKVHTMKLSPQEEV